MKTALINLTDFAVQYRYDIVESDDILDRPNLIAEVEALITHVNRLLHDVESNE